jgi:hypothetical protein
MGIFGNLMAKIVGHSARAQEAKVNAAVAANAPAPGIPSSVPNPTARPANAAPVDIEATLESMAAANKQKLDWRHSIVDLMKLVGMESSLAERKELAKELGYTGDMSDSASMNIWLHKEVMKKMAENGGKVPANMLD